jgi:hypothetical protein
MWVVMGVVELQVLTRDIYVRNWVITRKSIRIAITLTEIKKQYLKNPK